MQNFSDPTQGEHYQNWGWTEGGGVKMCVFQRKTSHIWVTVRDGANLQFITNRKWHTPFQMRCKSSTLNELESQYCNKNCIGCSASTLATARLACYIGLHSVCNIPYKLNPSRPVSALKPDGCDSSLKICSALLTHKHTNKQHVTTICAGADMDAAICPPTYAYSSWAASEAGAERQLPPCPCHCLPSCC